MNLRQTTPMKFFRSNAMFYLFGVAIIVNSLTTVVLWQRLFGGSTIQESTPTSLPSIVRNQEIQ
jgi:hypothetical protein